MLASVASVSKQVYDAAQLISTDFCWKCFKSNFEIWDIIAITKVFGVIKKTPANKTSDQTCNYTSICWSNQAWLYLALPGRDFILHRCNWYWSCHCSKVNWYFSVRASWCQHSQNLGISRQLRIVEFQNIFLHSENPFPFPGSQIFLGPNLNVLSLVFSCPMRLLAKPCGQQYVG